MKLFLKIPFVLTVIWTLTLLCCGQVLVNEGLGTWNNLTEGDLKYLSRLRVKRQALDPRVDINVLPQLNFLKSDLDRTKRELKNLEDHVDDVEISYVLSIQKLLESSFVTKYALLSQLKADQKFLTTQLHNKYSELSRVQSRQEHFELQVEDQILNIGKIESSQKQLLAQVTEGSHVMNQNEVDFNSMDGHVTTKLLQLQILNTNVRQLKPLLNDLDNDIQINSQLDATRLHAQVNDLSQKVKQIKIDEGFVAEELDKKVSAGFLKLQQQQIELNSHLEEKMKIIDDIQGQIRLWEGQVKHKTQVIFGLDKQLNNLEIGVGALEIKKDFEKLHNLLKFQVSREVSKLSTILEDLSRRHANQEFHFGRAKAEVNLLRESLKQRNDHVTKLDEKTRNLKRAIQEAQRNPVPLNFVYIQLGGQGKPKELWPILNWEDVTSEYAGLFFRTEDEAGDFGQIQEAHAPSIIEMTNSGSTLEVDAFPAFPCNAWSSKIILEELGLGGRFETDIEFDSLKFKSSKCHVRPVNQAIRIWRRRI